MKWFKKLFRGKFEKLSEPKSTKSQNIFRIFTSKKTKNKLPEVQIVAEPTSEEVFALTTIRNFRCDSLNEYVFQSEWVFVTREKLMEPKFQQHLTKTDALTNLCKKLAETSGHKKQANVTVRPPACHCSDLNNEEGDAMKDQYINPFKKMLIAFAGLLKRIYSRFKNCFCKIKLDSSVVYEEHNTDISNSYLCR